MIKMENIKKLSIYLLTTIWFCAPVVLGYFVWDESTSQKKKYDAEINQISHQILEMEREVAMRDSMIRAYHTFILNHRPCN